MSFVIKSEYENIPQIMESIEGVYIKDVEKRTKWYHYRIVGETREIELHAKLFFVQFVDTVQKLNRLLKLEVSSEQE